jgi:hypothetical protein
MELPSGKRPPMLANARAVFPFFLALALSIALTLPIQAQVNGVPPSITSMGFGGTFVNGVRPSVTSLGGNGKSLPFFGNCCANFFLRGNHNRIPAHHRHPKAHNAFPVGILEPAYIPYAAESEPDADDPEADQDELEADNSHFVVPAHPAKQRLHRAPPPAMDTRLERIVTAQLSTVLVFKDGHTSDVLNYAIVGDTLFDFAAGHTNKILLADLDLPATRKANDDRGVDFEIPAVAAGR